MLKEYKVLDGETTQDVVNKLYGSSEYYRQFIQDNYFILGGTSVFTGAIVNYDTSLIINNPPDVKSLVSPVATTGIIKGIDGQNLFDLFLMSYGTIEKAYKFLQENSIDSINTRAIAQNVFTYDLESVADSSLYNLILSRGYSFGTKSEDEIVVIPTYFILRSLYVIGHSWKFTIDDTGEISDPAEDIGTLPSVTEFILQSPNGRSWRFTVDDTGVLSSSDLGVLAGQNTYMLMKSLDDHIWKITTDNAGQLITEDLEI